MIPFLHGAIGTKPAPPNYSLTVTPDSPYGYWQFQETSGTSAADSGTGNHAMTHTNGPTVGVSTTLGAIPKAVTYDGSNDYSTTGAQSDYNVSASGTFSLEIWVKTTSSSFGTICGWGDGTDPGFTINLQINDASAGQVATYCKDGSGNDLKLYASANINNGSWHHLVVTSVAGGSLTLYVDGSAAASTSTSRYTKSTSRTVWVAANSGSGQYANATASEVAIYKTALSSARVLAHYQAGIAA